MRDDVAFALELSEIDAQLKVSREEHKLDLSEASRQLLRSLAHEVKNPLGGIRGAAQLLDAELTVASSANTPASSSTRPIACRRSSIGCSSRIARRASSSSSIRTRSASGFAR